MKHQNTERESEILNLPDHLKFLFQPSVVPEYSEHISIQFSIKENVLFFLLRPFPRCYLGVRGFTVFTVLLLLPGCG